MKTTTINKLSGIILGATGAFLLFSGSTDAFAANLNPAAHNEIGNTEIGSLVSFNLDRVAATHTNENIAFSAAEKQSSSGMNKWIAGMYYLMMMHLTLSFILASKSEET